MKVGVIDVVHLKKKNILVLPVIPEYLTMVNLVKP